jgi:hypothetical protein
VAERGTDVQDATAATSRVSLGGVPRGAALAGWLFEYSGSYSPAFVSAAVVAIIGGSLALAIRDEPVRPRSPPLAPAPAVAG